MSEICKIQIILRSKSVREGAGVHLQRVFGFDEKPLFDPFLLLDDFRSDDPEKYLKGFPWHPHRGIETITYVTAGEVEHGDSLGNSGIIGAGDVQWMTAGSGIIHQEMPRGDPLGKMYGFQLWANLPAHQKMMNPRYREITADQIPIVERPDGTTIKIIAGRIENVQGPVTDVVIDPEYLDISIPAEIEFTHKVNPGHTVFAYITGGKGIFADSEEVITEGTVVLFEPGDQVNITSGETGISILLISGKPLNEPVAWYGPIVMNTQEELQKAFEEYNNGSFIKHK